jgi:hypothetical protein
MPSPEATLIFALVLCAVLLLAIAVLADAVCRLRSRVEGALALARDARREVAVLTKALAYDREELSAAARHIDTLADHIARLEGTPEDRVIAKLSEPPRI